MGKDGKSRQGTYIVNRVTKLKTLELRRSERELQTCTIACYEQPQFLPIDSSVNPSTLRVFTDCDSFQ
jgi:hypothetical protein